MRETKRKPPGILLRMSRRKFFGLTFGRNRSRSAIDANIMALA